MQVAYKLLEKYSDYLLKVATPRLRNTLLLYQLKVGLFIRLYYCEHSEVDLGLSL